jgi:hypothetical protein
MKENGERETTSPNSTREGIEVKSQGELSIWRKVYNVLAWTPPNCRWDPEKPPQFSMSMNVLFAFAAGCTFPSPLAYKSYFNMNWMGRYLADARN